MSEDQHFDWRKFLTISTHHLWQTNRYEPCEFIEIGIGPRPQYASWCAWTTFSRLRENAGYWTAEILQESELEETYTTDGGTWGQPFPYSDLAHLIIPREFSEEDVYENRYVAWRHVQDIDGLSERLKKERIAHRLSKFALEIKLY